MMIICSHHYHYDHDHDQPPFALSSLLYSVKARLIFEAGINLNEITDDDVDYDRNPLTSTSDSSPSRRGFHPARYCTPPGLWLSY